MKKDFFHINNKFRDNLYMRKNFSIIISLFSIPIFFFVSLISKEFSFKSFEKKEKVRMFLWWYLEKYITLHRFTIRHTNTLQNMWGNVWTRRFTCLCPDGWICHIHTWTPMSNVFLVKTNGQIIQTMFDNLSNFDNLVRRGVLVKEYFSQIKLWVLVMLNQHLKIWRFNFRRTLVSLWNRRFDSDINVQKT